MKISKKKIYFTAFFCALLFVGKAEAAELTKTQCEAASFNLENAFLFNKHGGNRNQRAVESFLGKLKGLETRLRAAKLSTSSFEDSIKKLENQAEEFKKAQEELTGKVSSLEENLLVCKGVDEDKTKEELNQIKNQAKEAENQLSEIRSLYQKEIRRELLEIQKNFLEQLKIRNDNQKERQGN